MPRPRPRIPAKTKNSLLVKCKHSCCICGQPFVRIHHVDRNPGNNRQSNLIPLCHFHASMVHMSFPPSSGTQAITPKQLRLYKNDWIRKCNLLTPTLVNDIQDLKETVSELKGKIEKLERRGRR